jgi:uncharacterized damage-inducible protein DinB
MTDDGPNIAGFYEGWRLTNDRLIEALAPLSAEELAWRPGPEMWPIWALAGHLAGGRVYWLCSILKEPGAASTPFTDPSGDGWEDHPSEPRGADDLVFALRTSWAIVEDCLRRWSPEMLRAEFERVRGEVVQVHTRQSVLIRLITHDAYHCGEIALTLGNHGLSGGGPNGPIDMWAGLSRVAK